MRERERGGRSMKYEVREGQREQGIQKNRETKKRMRKIEE